MLDLGAAPGSWLLYAADVVGAEGKVVGVDLQPVRSALPPHARFLEGDVRTLDTSAVGSFDVVLSDMAPATTGQRHVDQARSFELFTTALDVAARVLAPGGRFCGKLFQGPELEEARAAVTKHFDTVRLIRPKATRSESIEVFLVGLGYRSSGQE